MTSVVGPIGFWAVVEQYGLDFIPIQEEHYDFAVPALRSERPAVQRLRALLQDDGVREQLRALKFVI